MLKVEGTTRGQTHPSRTDRWNEDIEVTVDKASEVEIAVYDKQGNEQAVPIGYLWIKIADIVEAQRRQKVENESVQGGWVTAAGAMRAPSDPNGGQGHGDFNYGGPASSSAHGAQNAAPEGLFAWFVVEPAGALGLHVNFSEFAFVSLAFYGCLPRSSPSQGKRAEAPRRWSRSS